MQAEPTIRQLRHFLSLAKHCHFGRAAEACFVTQSSLSASIKELENVLGTLLFERTKRKVMITPLGSKLMGMAQQVCMQLDELSDAARSAGSPLSGDLRMGVIPTIGPYLLPRVLGQLGDTYPDLHLYLREEQTGPLLHKLTDGELDLVLIALPFETEKTESFIFANDPFLAVFPEGHQLESLEAITPSRLNPDDLLVLSEGNCLTEQTLAMGNLGEYIHPGHFQATSLHTLVQMVANGLGVAILPKMAVDAGILRGLKVAHRPFSNPRARRKIALMWRSSSPRETEFRLLGKHFRDELPKAAGE
ncbi:MAG TPA: LysR family transcriptional regulator [Rhodospirillaceae bacterium]|nr:LysR family transcriptional regulator [Rhodospirillaceae bacterium]